MYGPGDVRVGSVPDPRIVEPTDALLTVTGAHRINYETLCNAEPALHSHLVPRYAWEPDDKRRRVPWIAYDWKTARRFDPAQDQPFIERMRQYLAVPATSSSSRPA